LLLSWCAAYFGFFPIFVDIPIWNPKIATIRLVGYSEMLAGFEFAIAGFGMGVSTKMDN